MPTLSPARPALLFSSRLFLVDRIGRVSRTTASIFTLSLLLSFAALFGFELIPELNASVGQASRDVAHLTRVVGGLMVGTLKSINAGLVELPWYVFACLVSAICIVRGKIRLSIFSMVICAYIFSVGYWNQTMSTVAMIVVALPIALVLGAALGLCAYYVPRLRQAIDLVLDFMQVVPALAYIIPLLVLFGFGPAPGIIASFVFAAPSMARNVMLALSGTPTVVMEATTMNGATRFQTLMLVQVPIGMRQLSLGLNQTVMAILAMTVFAATVGGVEDLGWSVLLVIRKADFGESVICGIVITLFAVILDRVSEPSANRPAGRVILIGLAAWVLIGLASVVMSSFGRLPVEVDASFLRHPLADQFNFAIATFTEWVYIPAAAIKNFIQVWLLLPMRLGALYVLDLGVYDKAGWPSIVAGFVLLSMFAVAGFRYARRNPVRVMIVVLCAVIYLGGLVTLPWFVCLSILTVIAFLLR